VIKVADIVIRGAMLVDGTGDRPRPADVAVSAGEICDVGQLDEVQAESVIDATGQVICPGFIDIHAHSDLTLLSSPLAQSKVRQGVTTEVVDNCGLGVAPLPPGGDANALRAAVSYLDLDPAVRWTWATEADYLEEVNRARPSLNVAALVGHIPLRVAAVGFEARPATGHEIDMMAGLLGESLDGGAFGLSTGLAYAPVCYADDTELTALARVVASRNATFAWHMRDYGDALIPAVEQVVAIAKATGCRMQISHLVAVGRQNWGAVSTALGLIEAANDGGAEIGADIYPYIAGNCPLSQILPYWAQEGDDRLFKERLLGPEARRSIKRSWIDRSTSWSDLVVSRAPGHEHVVGRSLETAAGELGTAPSELALDLLAEMGNAVTITAYGRSEEDVLTVLHHRVTVMGSDGQALDPGGATGTGLPHPRSYGCYPRLLSRYVANELPIERAIQMSSGAVATRLGLERRGRVAPGYWADLVVFEPGSITDRATFDHPHQYPEGISYVLVNGVVVVGPEGHLGARPGVCLLTSSRSPRGTTTTEAQI